MMRELKVTIDTGCMFVEVEYENMSEEVYQEYAYTYADDLEQISEFVADRVKLFTEKTDAELKKGLESA
jgi:hypothetical protein